MEEHAWQSRILAGDFLCFHLLCHKDVLLWRIMPAKAARNAEDSDRTDCTCSVTEYAGGVALCRVMQGFWRIPDVARTVHFARVFALLVS